MDAGGIIEQSRRGIMSMAAFAVAACSYFAYGQTPQNSFQPSYTVDGIVRTVVTRRTQHVTSSEQAFSLAFDNAGRWKMSLVSYTPKFQLTTTNVISYNGTDLFSVLYGDKRLDRNYRPVPIEDAKYPGLVARGPFPLDYGLQAGLIWIGFFGGEYLANNPSNSIPNLLVPTRRSPAAWFSDFQYTLLSGSANPLIASGSFVSNPKKITDDLTEYPELDEPTDSRAAEQIRQTLAQSADVSEEYTLQQSTLVGGRKIPTLFAATNRATFAPNDFALRVIQCIVTNITTNSPASGMLPELLGSISVQDRRFKQRTQTHYLDSLFYNLDSTGWIVSTNDARFYGKNGYYKGPHRRIAFVPRCSATKVLIVVAFLTLTLIPACVLGMRLAKNKNLSPAPSPAPES